MAFIGPLPDTGQASHLNILYAKDYRIRNDLALAWGNLTNLGNRCNG